MIEQIQMEIDACIEALRQGRLTEAQLRRVSGALDEIESDRQDLLYIQTGSSSLNSPAHGMMLVLDGALAEPSSPDEWPYKSPLEAIRDGWRVIQFPITAEPSESRQTFGLGCEFILEKTTNRTTK